MKAPPYVSPLCFPRPGCCWRYVGHGEDIYGARGCLLRPRGSPPTVGIPSPAVGPLAPSSGGPSQAATARAHHAGHACTQAARFRTSTTYMVGPGLKRNMLAAGLPVRTWPGTLQQGGMPYITNTSTPCSPGNVHPNSGNLDGYTLRQDYII